MKNLLVHLTILWIFVIASTISASDDPVTTQPPDEIIFRIRDVHGLELHVPLWKVDSYVANENLPVWLLQPELPEVLTPYNEITERVGLTTMYQNGELSAAAVYFHNLQEFYGTIDTRFILNGVSINDTNDVLKVKRLRGPGVIARHPNGYCHPNLKPVENKIYRSLINDFETSGERLQNESQSAVELRRNTMDVYYVQVFLIINDDVIRYLKQIYGKKFGIIRNLLTLFNSVDMLFSKLPDLNLKINIAGIIIIMDRRSLPALLSCYKDAYLDVKCIDPILLRFLRKNSDVILPDSYHVPIFFTSYSIAMDQLFSSYKLFGLTTTSTFYPYQIRKLGKQMGPMICAHYQEYFGSFPIVAHEITHAFKIKLHDKGPFTNENGECCASLMKPMGSFCSNCLKWSDQTQLSLKRYFSSRDRCFHISKPRSLGKPGPREILTADEQCKCYGFNSSGIPKRTIIDQFYQTARTEKCARNLFCYDHNGRSKKAPYPLDGTPCGEDADGSTMVCWAKKCLRVTADKI